MVISSLLPPVDGGREICPSILRLSAAGLSRAAGLSPRRTPRGPEPRSQETVRRHVRQD